MMPEDEILEWRKSVRWLARQFVERANALRWRGKALDDAAINYFVGAAKGLRMAGEHNRATWLLSIVLIDISNYGFKAVVKLADQEIPEDGSCTK